MPTKKVHLVTFLFNSCRYWEVVSDSRPETKEDFIRLVQEGIMEGSIPVSIGLWYKQMVRNDWFKENFSDTLQVEVVHPYGHPTNRIKAFSKELLGVGV